MIELKIESIDGRNYAHLNDVNAPAVVDALKSHAASGVIVSKSADFLRSNLNHLVSFPRFSALSISGGECDRMDVSCLSNLIGLEVLHLHLDVPKNLSFLEGLTSLRELRITMHRKQLFPRTPLENLRKLYVHDFFETTLKSMEVFRNLDSLELNSAKNLLSFDGLQACASLQNICISYCPKLVDISALSGLKLLRDVELTSLKRLCELDAGLAGLNLRRLIIDKVMPFSSLKFLEKSVGLEHLAILNTRVLDGDLSGLLNFFGLRHFVIRPAYPDYEPRPVEVVKSINRRAKVGVDFD